MKTLIKYQLVTALFSILLGSLISSCNSEDLDEMSEILDGKHKLRKLNVRQLHESNFSRGFFLGIGGISGSSKEIEKIRFSWELPNGQYVVSTFPISKVRIQLDSTANKPSIQFNLREKNTRIRKFDLDKINSDYYFYYEIKYVVIFCKQEDYIIDLNINDL